MYGDLISIVFFEVDKGSVIDKINNNTAAGPLYKGGSKMNQRIYRSMSLTTYVIDFFLREC